MSATQTQTEPPLLTLTLICPPEHTLTQPSEASTRQVTWDPKVIDNEFLHKKKMNCCPNCAHKRKNLFVPK